MNDDNDAHTMCFSTLKEIQEPAANLSSKQIQWHQNLENQRAFDERLTTNLVIGGAARVGSLPLNKLQAALPMHTISIDTQEPFLPSLKFLNPASMRSMNEKEETIVFVNRQSRDSPSEAITTTASWIDAASIDGGDDDEDSTGYEDSIQETMAVDDSSLSEASHSQASLTVVLGSTIPKELMTRTKTRRGKIPRLVKHDIRRYYGRMLYNVLNSHDRYLILRWFQTFSVQGIKFFRLEDLGPMVYSDKHKQEALLIQGRNTTVAYMLEVQRRIPDLVTRLNDFYQILRWKERQSSQIVFRSKYSGSTFEYFPEEERSSTAKELESELKMESPSCSEVHTESKDLACLDLVTELSDEFDRQTPVIPPLAPSRSNNSAFPSPINSLNLSTSSSSVRRISHVAHFSMDIETTLYLNDEMLLYRWESKALNADKRIIPYTPK